MISPDQPRCCICNKYVAVTFYCFGCKHFICFDCDDPDKWPPQGHTKPTQHFLTNPRKRKVKKMSKSTELVAVRNELAAARENAKYWCDAYERERKAHAESQSKHAQALRDQAKAHDAYIQTCAHKAADMIHTATLTAERDTMSRAFQHLADRLTQGE